MKALVQVSDWEESPVSRRIPRQAGLLHQQGMRLLMVRRAELLQMRGFV